MKRTRERESSAAVARLEVGYELCSSPHHQKLGRATTLHCHYAAQISISLGAPLQVRTCAGEPYTEQQSFIVSPNIPHQVEMTGVPSFVLWSEARALVDLAHRLSTTSASELPALPQDQLNVLLPVLLASGGQVPDEQAGQALLSHVLTQLLGPTWDEGPDDPRIATARSLVTPQFLVEQSQPITSLATRVHLSPSHSAHLTRVFRATFGLPPSRIFKNSHAVQVMPSASC